MNNRSMYIGVVHPSRLALLFVGPNNQEKAALVQHLSYLQQFPAQGRLMLAGRMSAPYWFFP